VRSTGHPGRHGARPGALVAATRALADPPRPEPPTEVPPPREHRTVRVGGEVALGAAPCRPALDGDPTGRVGTSGNAEAAQPRQSDGGAAADGRRVVQVGAVGVRQTVGWTRDRHELDVELFAEQRRQSPRFQVPRRRSQLPIAARSDVERQHGQAVDVVVWRRPQQLGPLASRTCAGPVPPPVAASSVEVVGGVRSEDDVSRKYGGRAGRSSAMLTLRRRRGDGQSQRQQRQHPPAATPKQHRHGLPSPH